MNTTQEWIIANEQVIVFGLPWGTARIIRDLLITQFKKDFCLISWSNDRHDSMYYIKPETKVRKAELHDMQMFVRGVRAAWRS